MERGGGNRLSLRSLRNLSTFSSLKNKNYLIYFGGLAGQMAAMNMQIIARSLLVYRITGSALILGTMSLGFAAPMLFLSLFGGVIADRVQKKYVMLIGQVFSAIIALSVALSLTFGYLSIDRPNSWLILLIAGVAQGIVSGLMMPSRQAILPEIVGEEQLMNAVSLNTLGMNAFRLFAPALGGFLIDAFNFEAVYYVMTALYLMSVVFIVFLPLTSTMSVRGAGTFAEIMKGVKYIRNHKNILLILIVTLFAVVLSFPYFTLLPIFADDILKVGATGMGMLLSVSGVGAIIGSLVLASLPNKKRGLMLLSSCLLLGIALIGFSFSNSWVLSLVLIAFVGLGQSGRMTLANTLLQYYVEDEYRGRVMSVYMMEFGLTSFGAFAAGALAENIGVQRSVGGFAIALVFLAFFALLTLSRIRKLD